MFDYMFYNLFKPGAAKQFLARRPHSPLVNGPHASGVDVATPHSYYAHSCMYKHTGLT